MRSRTMLVALWVMTAASVALWASGAQEPGAAAAGPVELSYFQNLGTRAAVSMQSYSEMYQFQVMEQKFNVKFKFIHPPQGQIAEQFNLMIASNELPDIISYSFGGVPGGPGKLLRDGTILKLNDIFSKHAPNISKVLSDDAEVRRQVMLDDGSFYMFPLLRIADNVRLNAGPAIRQDWLNKLGLQRPETIEQWYTVLKAFNEKDPNGNGNPADELPVISIGDEIFQRVFVLAWRLRSDFCVREDGKLSWGPIEPAFRDYLATMAQWYKEGLIDPDYITTDAKNFDAKVTGNKGGAMFAWMNGNVGRYSTLMAKTDPAFDLRGVIWPKAKDGVSYTGHVDTARMSDGQGAAISRANKHVELSARVLDYAYGEEGNMLFNFGKLGESYVIENGKIRFTDLILKNPKGLAPTNALTIYNMGSSGSGGAFIQDERYASLLREAIPQQLDAEKVWARSRLGVVPPPIQPGEADSSRLSKIMNEVNTYVSEMSNKIIMGIEPVSKFDEFVRTQKQLNIDEAIAIQQKAHTAYMARK